jgi:hypothetical protein
MKITSLLSLSLACAEDEPSGPPAPLSVVDAARAEIPTFLALQTQVIARSCSPNPGVCHQSNNYPDLRTPGSVLSIVGMPCNLEIPDRSQGWDACEARPDRLVVGGFASDIAHLERLASGRWTIGLRDAPPATRDGLPSITGPDEDDVILYAEAEIGTSVALVAGANEATLTVTPASEEEEDYTFEIDAILSTVRGGDPNGNGVYGFESDGGALIVPGELERSYLWGRVTGTAPGTRMPLANEPLSNAEYAALACWIEGLRGTPSVNDRIDYDRCSYAKAPIDYEVTSAEASAR